MYRLFLVEDEPFVLQSLKAILPWEEHGFSLAGEAGNGVDAYERIVAARPHLVFTDIVMPRMNGLELMQKTREVAPDILFVVLSGYAEFSYAMKAMSYGGLGYCLKPFDEKEIAAVLARARQVLDDARRFLELQLIDAINDSEGSETGLVPRLLTQAGLAPAAGPYVVLVAAGTEAAPVPAGLPSITLRLGARRVATIVAGAHPEALAAAARTSFPPGARGVGVSLAAPEAAALRSALEEASLAACRSFLTGVPGVHLESPAGAAEAAAFLRSVAQALERKAWDEIARAVAECGAWLSGGSCSARHAAHLYTTIMSFAARWEDAGAEEPTATAEELFDTYGSLSAMLEHAGRVLEQARERSDGGPRREFRNETFQKILHYIDENYTKPISLQGIARDYRANPSYLSQLFKKELDTTYTDHITRLRIGKAEELLLGTTLSITEISERAGFSDYFYFAKVFRKAAGMTPTEYRRTKRGPA